METVKHMPVFAYWGSFTDNSPNVASDTENLLLLLGV